MRYSVVLWFVALGCDGDVCVRHSDCSIGRVCTREATCAVAPDDGGGTVGDGEPIDATVDAAIDADAASDGGAR